MPVCPICGLENDKDASFCKGCGRRLVYAPPPPSPRDPIPAAERPPKPSGFQSPPPNFEPLQPHFVAFPLWGGVVVMLLAMVPFIIGAATESATPIVLGAFLLAAGLGGMIWGMVYALIILYRCWSLIPSPIARTTPGKAVGFLFIPFFNWYWVFQAVHGLAEDIHAWMPRYPKLPNKDLALVDSIFFIISGNGVDLVLHTVVAYQFAGFYNTYGPLVMEDEASIKQIIS